MHQIHEFLNVVNDAMGGARWFVYLLLGTGVFFTFYLGFPQIRYFKHALKIVSGKFDKKEDQGDTSHFQALATALSGTVGTGNIAGVALAINLGGPAALFWMLVTAFLGMCTKFVEVTLSHKYREFDGKGKVAGGPMYFMKKRLNIQLKSGKTIKTGYVMGGFFAVATIISSLGTGNLPQMKSIADALQTTFDIQPGITGAVLAILLGLVIIGGITRIAKVTEKLVPAMALLYVIGALSVLVVNYQNIIPSIFAVFSHVFSGTAATGGFLGATLAFAFNKGVNRGLFSNEAGQGSAPIAHSAARAHEPVSEGMVSILEPFIDTILICFLTGVVLLSSGVWNEKIENTFQNADIEFLNGVYPDDDKDAVKTLYSHINNIKKLEPFSGSLDVLDGKIMNNVTLIHSRSVAEDVTVFLEDKPLTGEMQIRLGKPENSSITMVGKSLIHSAPLTTEAFKRGLFGDFGQYIVAIGLLMFAFSTAISWSYYGDRATSYLFGDKGVIYFRVFYILSFFLAALVDTSIVWVISGITIVIMTLPNLLGILFLHKEMKDTVKQYWIDFKKEG